MCIHMNHNTVAFSHIVYKIEPPFIHPPHAVDWPIEKSDKIVASIRFTNNTRDAPRRLM